MHRTVHKFEHHSPLLNRGLLAFVEALEAYYPVSRLGVSSGWSSPKVVQDYQDAAVCRLLSLVMDRLEDVSGSRSWRLSMWANVLRDGQGVGVHDHLKQPRGFATWSGVFYPQTGSREGGRIAFPDRGKVIAPQDGDLIIFAADEPHCVETYRGEARRVSLAFNAEWRT